MTRLALRGNALTEYSVGIGLVALASLAGLKFLGPAISTTIGEVPNSPGIARMSNLDFRTSKYPKYTGNVQLQGSGYYYQTVDPITGAVEFAITDTANGNATNATSIDGTQWNSAGQFEIAETLIKLAEKQTDPANKAFIMALAKKSYYMGASEGEIDAVLPLQLHDSPDANKQYGKINGLNDIRRLQSDIMSLLQNPPGNLDAGTLQQVNALSLDVYNIGQSYSNLLSAVPANAKYSFAIPSDDISGIGNGTPGQALAAGAATITFCADNACGTSQSAGGPKVEDVYTIDYLRSVSSEVIKATNNTPATVVATLTDAQTLDKTASN
jgi:hypothetical protein